MTQLVDDPLVKPSGEEEKPPDVFGGEEDLDDEVLVGNEPHGRKKVKESIFVRFLQVIAVGGVLIASALGSFLWKAHEDNVALRGVVRDLQKNIGEGINPAPMPVAEPENLLTADQPLQVATVPLTIRQFKPGDAWKNLELTAEERVTLGGVRMSRLDLATSAKKGYQFGVSALPSDKRDLLEALVHRTFREGGVVFRADKPAAHGEVYRIGNPKETRRFFGFVSSLPPVGDQFASTFDVDVDGAFATASVMTGKQLRRDFVKQKQAQTTGRFAGMSLGRVLLMGSEPITAYMQAGVQTQLLNEGVHFGDGVSVTGRLSYTKDGDGEITGVKGTLFGRLNRQLTAYAIPIEDISCSGVGLCADIVGNLVAVAIDTQREAVRLFTGKPFSGR